MNFNFSFRTAEETRDLKKIIDFLAKQDLGYPGYDEWVQRAEAELRMGWKTGILALSEGRVVGDLIYQAHKTMPRVRELKNLRVHPEVRDRYFARFMLRQAELGLGTEFDLILCDARETQVEPIRFLASCGYRQIAKLNLYDEHSLDVVMAKAA